MLNVPLFHFHCIAAADHFVPHATYWQQCVYIVMHAVNNEILHVQPLIELFNAKTEHYCLNNNLIVNYFLVTPTHQKIHQVQS